MDCIVNYPLLVETTIDVAHWCMYFGPACSHTDYLIRLWSWSWSSVILWIDPGRYEIRAIGQRYLWTHRDSNANKYVRAWIFCAAFKSGGPRSKTLLKTPSGKPHMVFQYDRSHHYRSSSRLLGNQNFGRESVPPFWIPSRHYFRQWL